jgi:hypothetical protein
VACSKKFVNHFGFKTSMKGKLEIFRYGWEDNIKMDHEK